VAWNRSVPENGKRINNGQKRKSAFPMLNIVAILVILTVSTIVAWHILRDKTESLPASNGDGSRLIKEVQPSPSAKTNIATNKVVYSWLQPTPEGLSGPTLERWKQYHRPKPSHTNNYFITRPKLPYEIFPTRAENEIAMLLTIEPGETLVGEEQYERWFKDEFLKSCEVPIVIRPEDSEYEKQLKKDMIQTKIDLRQRIADGEDICKIMSETRNEAMRLGILRQEIVTEARRLVQESQSEDDIDDCVKAVNKVLESKGMAPFEVSPIVRRGIMRRILRNQQTAEEN